MSKRPLTSRKLWAIVSVAAVLVVAALPLTGCPIQIGRPGMTITVWDGPRWADASGNRYHWIQQKISEFEASHPFVEVNFVPVEWDDLRGMLDAAEESGQLPDIAPFDISAGGVTVDEVRAGLLEPVESAIESPEDISPEAIDAYTVDGHLWGFPESMTGQVMLLNLDLFAERGVEPPIDGKWTWDEFVAACRQLTFDRDGDNKTDVYGFGTYILPGYYEAWPFLYAGGSRPISDDLTTYTFNTPETVDALQRLADLASVDKVAHPSTGSAGVKNMFDLFAQADKQEIAIEPWAPWAIDYLKTQDGMIQNVGVAEYPTLPGETATTIGATAGFVVFHQGEGDEENESRKSEVFDLANYLTSATSQYELARGYNVFPARQAALDLDPFAGDPVYTAAAKIAFQAESLPKSSLWPDIDRLIQREVQLALLGVKSPADALSDAAESVQELLDEANAPPAPADTPSEAVPGDNTGGNGG